LRQFERIVDLTQKAAPRIHRIAQRGRRFTYFLRCLGVIPEIRRGNLFVQFRELIFL
jgi:hypothetical protein